MKTPRILASLLPIVMLGLSGLSASAQQPTELSISVYPGFTLVNFEKALDYSDDYMEDWEQFYIAASLRGFKKSEGNFQLGGELAWQQLYYAYYVVPYVPHSVYREFNVTTFSLTALARLSSGRLLLAGGPGVHLFSEGIAPSVSLEVGYSISLGEKIIIPLSLRVNPIFGDGLPTPISIGVGAGIRL